MTMVCSLRVEGGGLPAMIGAMELRPFAASDAELVSGWAVTHTDVLAWSSMSTVPVEPSVIVGWSLAPGVDAFVLVDGMDPVAYGEVWIDADAAEVELGRLIVDPRCRGRSIGRQLTHALTAVARASSDDVFLRVRPENTAARRCYEGAGFVRVSLDDEAAWNEGQPADYVWMQAVPLT